MIRRWFLYLTTVLGLMVLYLAHQQWLSWLLLLGCLSLPVFSLVISLPAMLTFRARLTTRGAVTLGPELILNALVRCPFPMPMHRLQFRVSHSFTGEELLLEPGDRLPGEHCGKLLIAPEKCRVYDYFGLFFLPVKNIAPSELLLRPKKISRKDPKELQDFLTGSWKPKPGGGFSEQHELRLYRPGDSMNQIHWKLSAKTGKLILREAMEPARGRILITLDLKGEPQELDRLLERLLFLGGRMTELGLPFTLCALTGQGRKQQSVLCPDDLTRGIDLLLACTPAQEGTLATAPLAASWRYHIGGAPDET